MAADLLSERLPQDWSYGVTEDGRVFFISDRYRQTTWLHPDTGRPVQTGHQGAPGLPNGWEQDCTPEGVTYFIDHKNQRTTFSHPVIGRPISEESPPPMPSSPPLSPGDKSDFKHRSASSKQRNIQAPSAKRNPNTTVVRQGFLYQLEGGGISKAWKRRWCVLADFALFIYKNDDEKITLGSILLPSYRINRCTNEDPISKHFAFKVEHENTKTAYFHTDTQTDLDHWLSTLQMAAAMKGGFYREANNNIKPLARPGSGVQMSPPYSERLPKVSQNGPAQPAPEFHTQWHNPNPSPGSGQNQPSREQHWRSVPDLGGDHRYQGHSRDSQSSLQSLPHDVQRVSSGLASNLRPDNRSQPQYQSFDPRMGRPKQVEYDPRGSLRSLQPNFSKDPHVDFVPLAQQSGVLPRDQKTYNSASFQPYQRQHDPRASWHGSENPIGLGPHQRDEQRLPSTGLGPGSMPGVSQVNESPHSMNGQYKIRNGQQPAEQQRNGVSLEQHARRADVTGYYADPTNGQRDSYSDSGSRQGSRPPQSDSRYHQDSGHFAQNSRPHPGPSNSVSRLNSSVDPRLSYASSRHSLTEQEQSQGSKRNLFSPPGTRRSLSRLPQQQPHPQTLTQPLSQPSPSSQPLPSSQPQPPPRQASSSLRHTYSSMPEKMQRVAQQQQQQMEDYHQPPGRPPYPAELREQLVRDLAEAKSPATAQQLLAAHQLNKERMQQSPFFQYPTPPRNSAASRLDDSQGSDSVKRLFQHNDPSTVAKTTSPSDVSPPVQRSEGRRQDSSSTHLSDSFEQQDKSKAGKGQLGQGQVRGHMPDQAVPPELQFGGDPEAKNLRQAYERVQSFRQSSQAVREGLPKRPILTVREEPDMPENEVLETKQQKKAYPLNGTRLRMSISAGDLIGKTHDELVLLLIQLRRNQSALEKARDFYRESLNKRRSSEREYRRQRHDSVGRLECSLEENHQSFVDIRSQLEEVENKIEVYRPLINLVDNMVTMGSLYGGDNLMLATQYRKHLLRPDQYQPPRKMLEFSRQHQEDRVIAGIENDVRQLTATEVDLEEKIDRLNQLQRMLQEQSFKVSSFKEDKELLEKALQGIVRQMREMPDSPYETRRLQQQQNSVEKELSRVTQDLAEASKALEETTVENNKIEHEVALLRTKVHGELKRSKSAPSLVTETANMKVKMERELARVQNMLQGLSQQGEKLSQQMSTIRRSSSGTQLAAAFDAAEKSRKKGTYLQTDIDTGQEVDLSQQIPDSPESPVSPLSPNAHEQEQKPLISHKRQEATFSSSSGLADTQEWDIGDADDNTKRFYGLLPKEKSRGLTVRDVKRQSEQRRERKRDEEGQEVALKVSSTDDDTTTFVQARYRNSSNSQSHGLDLAVRDPQSSERFYENLPRSGSMPALNDSSSASRRSSITLLAPKPFVPYHERTVKPFKSDLALNVSSQSRVANSDHPFLAAASGDTGLVRAQPQQAGKSAQDSVADPASLQAAYRVNTFSAFNRTPQPFSRDKTGLTTSTQHLNSFESSGATKLNGYRAIVGGSASDLKRSPKGRFMTISSSQPSVKETGDLLKRSAFSTTADMISNGKVDNVPDVVKSSLTNVDKIDDIDQDTIDRHVLYFPEKVHIPERYDPEADAEQLTEEQKQERQEKAERIKRLLTNQSMPAVSQPDVSSLPPEQLHSEVMKEKRERAHILTLNQELARQVTLQSRRQAAERRKTWSGDQLKDIKAQYEAEQAAMSPGLSSSPNYSAHRRANVLL